MGFNPAQLPAAPTLPWASCLCRILEFSNIPHPQKLKLWEKTQHKMQVLLLEGFRCYSAALRGWEAGFYSAFGAQVLLSKDLEERSVQKTTIL